jgi:hypothetical protein
MAHQTKEKSDQVIENFDEMQAFENFVIKFIFYIYQKKSTKLNFFLKRGKN